MSVTVLSITLFGCCVWSLTDIHFEMTVLATLVARTAVSVLLRILTVVCGVLVLLLRSGFDCYLYPARFGPTLGLVLRLHLLGVDVGVDVDIGSLTDRV